MDPIGWLNTTSQIWNLRIESVNANMLNISTDGINVQVGSRHEISHFKDIKEQALKNESDIFQPCNTLERKISSRRSGDM